MQEHPVAAQSETPTPTHYQKINAYTRPIYALPYLFLGMALLSFCCTAIVHFQYIVAPHQALRTEGVIATVTVFDQWSEEIQVPAGETSSSTETLYYIAYILPDADLYRPQIIAPCTTEVGISLNIVSEKLTIVRSGFDALFDWQKAVTATLKRNDAGPWTLSPQPCVNITQTDAATFAEIEQGDKIDIVYAKNDLHNAKLLVDYEDGLKNGLGTAELFWAIGIMIALLVIIRWLEVRAQGKHDQFRIDSVITKGKIIDIHYDSDSGSLIGVSYTYLERFQAYQPVTRLRTPLAVGDEITVLYLLERPEIAEGDF